MTTSVPNLVREMRSLKPTDYRRVVIKLNDRSDPSVTGVGQGQAYQVPTTHKFILTGVRGAIEVTDLAQEIAEAAVPAGSATIAKDIHARMLARAERITIKLFSKEKQEHVFEKAGISLAAITPEVGGEVVNFKKMPHIVNPGESLQFEPTFLGGGPTYITAGNLVPGVTPAPYDVGVTLEGILVPKSVLKGQGDVLAFLTDMQNLNSDVYRRCLITLEAAPPADGSEVTEVEYAVPGNYMLVIFGLLGHVTMDHLETETDAGADAGIASSLDVKSRLIARAARCYARLKLTNHGEDVEIIRGDAKQIATRGGGISVGSILPQGDGQVMDWSDAPQTVAAGEVLKLNLAWAGAHSATGIVGNDATYGNNSRFGVTLIAALVRVSE